MSLLVIGQWLSFDATSVPLRHEPFAPPEKKEKRTLLSAWIRAAILARWCLWLAGGQCRAISPVGSAVAHWGGGGHWNSSNDDDVEVNTTSHLAALFARTKKASVWISHSRKFLILLCAKVHAPLATNWHWVQFRPVSDIWVVAEGWWDMRGDCCVRVMSAFLFFFFCLKSAIKPCWQVFVHRLRQNTKLIHLVAHFLQNIVRSRHIDAYVWHFVKYSVQPLIKHNDENHWTLRWQIDLNFVQQRSLTAAHLA